MSFAFLILRCFDNFDVFKSLSSLSAFLHLNIKFAKLKPFKVLLLHRDGPAVNTFVQLLKLLYDQMKASSNVISLERR